MRARMCVTGARDGNQPLRSVQQPDMVSKLGEPERICAGAAADVEDVRWRLRDVAHDQLTGAQRFELECAVLEARLLGRRIVVRLDRWIEGRLRVFAHCHPSPSISSGAWRLAPGAWATFS